MLWLCITTIISFFHLECNAVKFVCTNTAESGSLDVEWIHGSANCSESSAWLPAIQVHKYDKNTYILRQNKCLHYEAPFFYLLFGENKVLLEDTGAGPTTNKIPLPIRDEIEKIITQWLSEQVPGRLRDSLELIAAHSHLHGDHVYYDSQFINQSYTTVVGLGPEKVSAFFGIAEWPTEIGVYDLGQRSIAVIPIPGHAPDSVAFYDCNTNLLLTGDSMYPGRLYMNHPNISIAISSVDRLQAFIESVQISHVLGTHIEMTNEPGIDYPIETTYQPDEHKLELPAITVKELQIHLRKMKNATCNEAHNDFIIYGGWPDGFPNTCPKVLNWQPANPPTIYEQPAISPTISDESSSGRMEISITLMFVLFIGLLKL